jgi:O-antigen/teichoic acid export membrane protein
VSAWLARRTATLALGQMLARGGPLIAVLVLVRALPGAQWDQLALLLSIYLAAQSLGTLNLQHGVIFFAARVPRAELRSLIDQTEALLLATGAVTAVLILGATFVVAGSAVDVSRWLPGIALAVVIEAPCACAPQALLAVERATAAALWEGGMAALTLAGICVPVLCGAGVDGAIFGLVVCSVIRAAAFATLLAFVFPPAPPSLRRPARLIRPLVRYALPLGLSLAAGAINQGVDKWLVAALDPHAFGSYAVAAQELPVLTVVPYAMAAALATRMVSAFQRGELARARDYWHVQTTSMTLLVVPIVVGLVLCGPEIIAALYGDDRGAAVLPFQIFALIGLHRVADYGLVMRAADRGRVLLAASALLLGLNLAFGAPLTALWGARATTFGTLAANAIAWLYVLTRIASAMGTRLRDAFPWRLYACTLGLAGSIAWITSRLVDGLAPKAIVYVTGWLLVSRLLRLRALAPAVPVL